MRNTHTGPEEGAVPAPGDISICWSCRQLGVYDSNGDVRMPTREEYAEAVVHPEVRKALHLTYTSSSPSVATTRWRES